MSAIVNWLPIIAIIGLILWEVFDKDKGKHRGVIIASVAFVIGIAVFGSYFLQSRQVDRGLRVTGYSSKLFESDLVKWTLSLQKNSSIDGLKEAYNSLSKDVADFKASLISQGLVEKDINICGNRLKIFQDFRRRRGFHILGKFDGGLQQDQGVDQPLPQELDLFFQTSFKVRDGSFKAPGGAGRYQVSDSLRLGQVDPVVEKGPAGEFTRFGKAGASLKDR